MLYARHRRRAPRPDRTDSGDQFQVLRDARRRWRAHLGDVLGPRRFEDVHREGADLPVDEVVAYAFGEPVHAR